MIAGNLGKLTSSGKFTLGLGGTIAKDLLEAGATVVITDIDDAVAQKCAEELKGNIHVKTCDFLQEREATFSQVETERGIKNQINWVQNASLEMVNEIVSEFGTIDVVVSNFDYYKSNRVDKSSVEFFDELKKFNIEPTFKLMAALRDALAKQKKEKNIQSRIILITNIAGKAGISLSSIYSAMKGGDIGLTKCLAREFSRFANVNAISYGLFEHKNMQGPKSRMKKNFMTTSTEISGQPLTFDKVAPVASFLASDAALGMNGQILNVDGGLWLKLES